MKSLLRIIIGVLVGVGIFIGIGFIGAHAHTGISFAKADYTGRCLDNVVYIGIGICWLWLLPGQVKRAVESGRMSETKAKTASKIRWPVGCVIICYGLFNTFVG
ncbi:MAG TPA: hypothetical protein VJT54_09895 [Verrucomicrobiae bacterium]|nr:hypothetical protein [Verrucomicrobiae bacterium]